MDLLDRIGRKLDVLRSHVRAGYRPNYGVVAEPAATPSLSDVDVRHIESEHHITLPREYREFLLRFGNGVTGPSHFNRVETGLSAASRLPFPLAGPFLGRESPDHNRLPEDQQWAEYGRLLKEFDAIPADHGVLIICEYGCGMSGRLILNGPRTGNVWLLAGDAAYYGPFGGGEQFHDATLNQKWVPTDAPMEFTFGAWYESWLDGELKMAVEGVR
jgi:hypothetical protein